MYVNNNSSVSISTGSIGGNHSDNKKKGKQPTQFIFSRRRMIFFCLIILSFPFLMYLLHSVFRLARPAAKYGHSIQNAYQGGKDSKGLTYTGDDSSLRNPSKEENKIISSSANDDTQITTKQYPNVEKENCEYIKDRLNNGESVGGPLPQAGKENSFSGIFWLKQPMKHTVDPVNGKEIMVLKYNKYLPTQHTEKWTNTVSILKEFPNSRLFPKMYAYCRDIGDGFHYIAVEYIDLHMNELSAPTKFDDCYDRWMKALDLFVELDELHLTLADFKQGQWMARKDGSFVLQDVDDIVHAPFNGEMYKDQVEYLIVALQNRLHASSLIEADRPWRMDMFPKNTYTIRYPIVSLDILYNDLGFSWRSKVCKNGAPSNYEQCAQQILDWATKTIDDTWPAPFQVKQAFLDCRNGELFQKTTRPKAAWRDLEPDTSKYVPATACLRAYDRPEGLKEFTRCQHSCCRAGSDGNKCYYTTDESNCK